MRFHEGRVLQYLEESLSQHRLSNKKKRFVSISSWIKIPQIQLTKAFEVTADM